MENKTVEIKISFPLWAIALIGFLVAFISYFMAVASGSETRSLLQFVFCGVGFCFVFCFNSLPTPFLLVLEAPKRDS